MRLLVLGVAFVWWWGLALAFGVRRMGWAATHHV